MKREFLEGLEIGEEKVKLSKEVVDSIMAEHGKVFKEKDEQYETLTTEKDGLKTQLGELNTKVKDLSKVDAEGLQAKLDEMNAKYDTDTNELRKKLSDQSYEYKVKDATNGLKFSSESAKKAFMSDLKAKELKLENDKILGFDDFVNSYKETDPDAFAKEEDPNEKDPAGVSVNTGGDHNKSVGDEDAFVNKVMGLDEK
jgi:predicted  nucleic acid-binding Zn-ribbon protein